MKRQYPTLLSAPARLANVLGAGLKHRVRLSEDYLLERARTATGLEDFGGMEFLAPMRILLDSFEHESNLHLVGRLLTQRDILHCLSNRLRIQQYLTEHPETAAVPVPSPVVITGFPRAGTTFLHRLLAQDTTTRVLRSKELFLPVPPQPGSKGGDLLSAIVSGCRKRAANMLISREGRARRKAIHDSAPDAPEECWPLLQNSFVSEVFGLGARTRSYGIYVSTADFTGAYRYYRRQIQILTAAAPAQRLLVKHPGHLGHLEDLATVFPGARIIWCHRDPLQVLASSCSLAATGRSARSDHVDLKEIGSTFFEYAVHRLERGLAARRNLGEDRFIDVHYREFVADPMKTVRRLYDLLGWSLTAETEATLDRWLAEDKRARRRMRHEYTPEMFGLDPAKVNAAFREYGERFTAAPPADPA